MVIAALCFILHCEHIDKYGRFCDDCFVFLLLHKLANLHASFDSKEITPWMQKNKCTTLWFVNIGFWVTWVPYLCTIFPSPNLPPIVLWIFVLYFKGYSKQFFPKIFVRCWLMMLGVYLVNQKKLADIDWKTKLWSYYGTPCIMCHIGTCAWGLSSFVRTSAFKL